MKLFTRIMLLIAAATAFFALILIPLTDRLIGQWAQHDVEIRSRLIYVATEKLLLQLINNKSQRDINLLFDKIAEDERVVAMAVCNKEEQTIYQSKSWQNTFGCKHETSGIEFHKLIYFENNQYFISYFKINGLGHNNLNLVIVHNLNYAINRMESIKFYLIASILSLALIAALITYFLIKISMRELLNTIRSGILQMSSPINERIGPNPVASEIRQLIRDLEKSTTPSEAIRVDWSAETLSKVIKTELADAEIIVVSNREPYIHNKNHDGTVTISKPASGVVTALEPIVRTCNGVWIAHGSGNADQDVVDNNSCVFVPPENPSYTLKRLWLSELEEKHYYLGLSNEGLWPLCHISYVRPIFREIDWDYYVAINEKFAKIVIEQAKTDHPIVLVQDYHLALAPRKIRDHLPNATIITFWHIPWPNSEIFGICPWREQIIDGLLASTVLGFHTQLHCNNFIETADRFLECHIDREHSTISSSGGRCLIRPYPISIEWPPEPMQHQLPTHECRCSVFEKYGFQKDVKLVVGVERFDFTKGIPDRLRAIDIFLEKYPEWHEKFVFLQIAAPTRGEIPAYSNLRNETVTLVEEINAKYRNNSYEPIKLIIDHHEPDEIYQIFRAADACIVSSLHDGMNLVAKEFVAARDDNQGVLILSTFAGASRELMDALIVNPFDAKATADAINQALQMPSSEQRDRMILMRDVVSESNVYFWAGRMLLDASRIRKRQNIDRAIDATKRRSVS